MRFIICIRDFRNFKKNCNYATPFLNLSSGIRQFSYQIFTRSDYKFLDTISDKEFSKNFMYYGEFKIELEWCEEVFNILMNGEGDLYKILC